MASRRYLRALLMAKTRVDLLAAAFGRERGVTLPIKVDTSDAQTLAMRLTDLFDVSRDAARVRLLKRGHLAG